MSSMTAQMALLATLAVTFSLLLTVQGERPMFVESLENLTVRVGRDATFTCVVRHLGGYRVGWVKADTKAIQAIHTHVITHNPRVRVSHRDQTTWNLHINQVQPGDNGTYMCQINYDPMMSQYGMLDVVVPPDILSDESSGDMTIPEGGSGELQCAVHGVPEPKITWRREDGLPLQSSSWRRNNRLDRPDSGRGLEYEGKILPLEKVKRSDTGYYLCIASNGVPPSVSKKIKLEVHFHPVVQVPTQLLGVPLGADVTLRCHVEALPKSINYWNKQPGAILIQNGKLNISETRESEYSLWMTLTIHHFEPSDAGDFICTAKNSIGEVQSTIQVYEIRNREPGTPAAELDGDVEYRTSEEQLRILQEKQRRPADREHRLDLVPALSDAGQAADGRHRPDWSTDEAGKTAAASTAARLGLAGRLPLLLVMGTAAAAGQAGITLLATLAWETRVLLAGRQRC